MFAADMAQRVSHSTIRTYLAAVRYGHISQGLGDPLAGTLQLTLLLRGVQRIKPSVGRSRLPVTPLILLRLKEVLALQPQDYDSKLLWAACTAGFFAFLSSGEFTCSTGSFDPARNITPNDIAVDSHAEPTLMRITIKASKTDQLRQGVDLFVGRTRGPLCPVAAILDILAVRAEAPGPLVTMVSGSGLIS